MKNILIGVSGGTGSGKTTVSKKLKSIISHDLTVDLIQQDSYYKDRSNIPESERDKINFDHPDSIDFKLLAKHLKLLKNGDSIKIPNYDFISHTRNTKRRTITPKDVIILEGILIFVQKDIRDIFDYKVFVDTPDDVRVLRRLKRDIQDRGRSFESVFDQYLNTVRPMHIEFVDPSKQFADIIIPEGGFNLKAIDIISKSILNSGD